MKIFKLPDLGEGLPDATIQEWYVKVGDDVSVDQALLAMETAKAVVDVPSPIAGKVAKLYGKPGDIINTGDPLIEFEDTQETKENVDKGTVVGNIEVGDHVIEESATGVEQQSTQPGNTIKATPAVRQLANKLGVDLSNIHTTGHISVDDVLSQTNMSQSQQTTDSPIQGEKLSSVRRMMALTMSKSHHEIVPVTIMDDADISHWSERMDVTLRLIKAIKVACQAEPNLNAYFDGNHLTQQVFKEIHLGMAVDTKHGLYVPVLKNIETQNDEQLRENINQFKEFAKQNKFPPEMLQGATITLSNFGVFAGRYANPIIVPPQVAIIAVGKSRQETKRILPISLTFDHRVITGGEAARFLAALLESLK